MKRNPFEKVCRNILRERLHESRKEEAVQRPLQRRKERKEANRLHRNKIHLARAFAFVNLVSALAKAKAETMALAKAVKAAKAKTALEAAQAANRAACVFNLSSLAIPEKTKQKKRKQKKAKKASLPSLPSLEQNKKVVKFKLPSVEEGLNLLYKSTLGDRVLVELADGQKLLMMHGAPKSTMDYRALASADLVVSCNTTKSDFDGLAKTIGKLRSKVISWMVKGDTLFVGPASLVSGPTLGKMEDVAAKALLEMVEEEAPSVETDSLVSGPTLEDELAKILLEMDTDKDLPLTEVQRLFEHGKSCYSKTKLGRLRFRPSKKYVQLLEEAELPHNKNGRLVIPAIGENKEELLSGVPLWAINTDSGEVRTDFIPQLAIQASCVKMPVIESFESDNPFVTFAKKGWSGFAQVLDMFGLDGVRAYASLSSTNCKTAYNTAHNEKTVLACNLSSPESIDSLPLFVFKGESQEEQLKNKEFFKTCFGVTGNKMLTAAKVDGMSLCGNGAQPGPSKAFQMRLIDTHCDEELEMWNELNKKTRDLLKKKWAKAKKRLESVAKEQGTNLSMMPEAVLAAGEKIYNSAAKDAFKKLKQSEYWNHVKVRYAKGLCQVHPSLSSDVILLDVNAFKGRNKAEISDMVQQYGHWKTNDLMFGFYQDINCGYVALSWQGFMYFLDVLPEDIKIPHPAGNGKTMAGKPGFACAMHRAFMKMKKALELVSTGTVNTTMKQIFDIIVDEQDGGKYDMLTERLWNNKTYRKEVYKWIQSYIKTNHYMFQTKGMEKINTILPEKRYVMDCNSLLDHPYIQIPLHDGSVCEAHEAILVDKDFWAAFPNRKQVPVVLFRHPISDKRTISIFMFKKPEGMYAELAQGVHMNSKVVKDLLTGDTDGDTVGYFPLDCFNGEALNFECEDYGVLYTVVKGIEFDSTNVEYYMKKLKNNQPSVDLGKAELVETRSAALIGELALLQGQIVRLHNMYLKDQLWNKDSKALYEFGTLILEPWRREMAALLELAICMKKKNVYSKMVESMNKCIFGVTRATSMQIEKMQNDIFQAIMDPGDHISLDDLENKLTIAKKKKSIDLDFNDHFASAICRKMAKFVRTCRVITNGEKEKIRYSPNTKTRFSDQENPEDPEMLFGARSLERWGIFESSGIPDSVGKWNDLFKFYIEKKIKPCADLLVQEVGENLVVNMNDSNEMKAQKKREKIVSLCCADRAVVMEQWKNLIDVEVGEDGRLLLSPKERNNIHQLYYNKSVISQLGFRVSPFISEAGNEAEKRPTYWSGEWRDFLRTKPSSSAAAFIGLLLAKHFVEGQKETVQSGAFMSPSLFGIFENAVTRGIYDRRQMASVCMNEVTAGEEMVIKFKKNNHKIQTAETREQVRLSEIYSADWLLRQVGLKTKKELSEILLSISGQASQMPDADWIANLYNVLFKRCKVNGQKTVTAIMKLIKLLRPMIQEVKAEFQDEINRIEEEMTEKSKVSMWYMAHDRLELFEFMQSNLDIPLTSKNSVMRAGVDYFLSIWSLDYIKTMDKFNSKPLSGKAGNGSSLTHAVMSKEVLDYVKTLGVSYQLQARPVRHEDQSLYFPFGERKVNMHATEIYIITDAGDEFLFGVVWDSVMQRLILGHDVLHVTLNKPSYLSDRSNFAPVQNYWLSSLNGGQFQYEARLVNVYGKVDHNALRAEFDTLVGKAQKSNKRRDIVKAMKFYEGNMTFLYSKKDKEVIADLTKVLEVIDTIDSK